MSNEPAPARDPSLDTPADNLSGDDEHSPDEVQTTWDAQGRYWLLGGAAFISGILLLYQLFSAFDWVGLIFALIALFGGGWSLWMATTSVELLPDGLRLKRIAGSRQITFPQILSVSAQGRLVNVLTVIYHPRRADGIVDTDAVSSLLIPALKNQTALLEVLEAKVPQ